MGYALIGVVVSVIASMITTKFLATYYFKIVNGYVSEMCNMTNESNKEMLAIIRKLQQSSDQEE